MAFKKASHNKPEYSISTSVAIRKGKYIKGPSFGLWIVDNGPVARGSVKEDYLAELTDFLKKAAAKDLSVQFALFRNDEKKKKYAKEDEEEDEADEEEEEDEEDEEDEEEEEEEEEPAPKKTSKKKQAGKAKASGGKKASKWDFDSEEDD